MAGQSGMSSVATYDPASPIGQCRLHMADTDVSLDKVIFTDSEITYFLSISGSDPIIAAAWGLEAAAVDAAKVARIVSAGGLKVDRTKVPEQLAARAATLRSLSPGVAVDAVGSGLACSPDRVFSTDSACAGVYGTMDNW